MQITSRLTNAQQDAYRLVLAGKGTVRDVMRGLDMTQRQATFLLQSLQFAGFVVAKSGRYVSRFAAAGC